MQFNFGGDAVEKKNITIILLAIVLFFLASCTSNKEIAVGRYYLGNDDEVYIEIIDNTTVAFRNADFTEVAETLLLDFGLELNIENGISVGYEANEKYDTIFVDIYGSEAGEFRPTVIIYYSHREKTLTLSDNIYIKR